MLLIIIALLLLDVVYNNKAIRAIITEVQELVSAHKRSTLLEELKVLIKQIEEEGSSYTEKKWEEVNEEFSELLQKLNSYEDLSAELNSYEDLSAEELREIAELQGQYAATVFKEHAGKAMEKAGAVLDGFVEGLTGDDENGEQAEEQDE